jgi:hypothetical protein
MKKAAQSAESISWVAIEGEIKRSRLVEIFIIWQRYATIFLLHLLLLTHTHTHILSICYPCYADVVAVSFCMHGIYSKNKNNTQNEKNQWGWD